MPDQTTFERNLLALSRNNHETALTLSSSESGAVTILTSRSGRPVPCLPGEGKPSALHSLFDPEREAVKIGALYEGGGFCVMLGFGGGYLARELLKNPLVAHVLIVESDARILKSILSSIDCSDIFSDPRARLLVDPDDESLKTAVLSTYVPSLSGDFVIAPLRSRVEISTSFFEGITRRLKELLQTISDDYSVQAYFGKRWFRNTLRNLRHADGGSAPLPPIRRAIVTAAGPSLEDSIERIRKLADRYAIIATDTTLPCLVEHGIKPAIVISIDCQHISYYHFIRGIPPGIPLVLDLASPEGLTRFGGKPCFFSSGHPFSRYITSHWRQFPIIDTSGGNVTHAAVSLASTLGAEEILLFGADFSYPDGKSYARGTYIYPHFEKSQWRLSPLEHDFVAFIFRNVKVLKEHTGETIRYSTKPLIGYKESLERFACDMETRLVPMEGRGVPVSVPAREVRASRHRSLPLFSAGNSILPLRDFIAEYRRAVESIPSPGGLAFGAYFSGLDDESRDALTTLLPAAARIRYEGGDRKSRAADLVDEVRLWALGELDSHYPRE